MASVARQPFAPLDGARLQNLTSIKNRQNALTPNAATKRKASLIEDADDFENLDPAQFSKRSKGLSSFFPNKEVYKSAIVLTTTTTTPKPAAATTTTTPLTAPALPTPASGSSRPIASPRRSSSLLGHHRHHHKSSSSVSKFGGGGGINKSSSSSSPLVPAGRTPPSSSRSKRSGLLTSRRRAAAAAAAGPYSRIDPPRAASTAAAPPFSLDAALKGSIPSYAARAGNCTNDQATSALLQLSAGKARAGGSMRESWFFDIHEDTAEQEMTNLLQHSTCVLDISSDEESETKRRRERDEGRDKENVPPADDVSQTPAAARGRGAEGKEVVMMMGVEGGEKVDDTRVALREMDVTAYFAEGCDERSIFVVPGDEDAETVVDEAEMREREREREQGQERETRDFVFAAEVAAENVPLPGEERGEEEELLGDEILADVPSVDELMQQHSGASMGPEAAVLQPVEGTQAGESFELWESGSAKDENEVPVC